MDESIEVAQLVEASWGAAESLGISLNRHHSAPSEASSFNLSTSSATELLSSEELVMAR